MKKFLSIILACLMLLAACTACSNSESTASGSDYPKGNINMIVNFSAGGGTDIAARAMADVAAKSLGTAISVTNVTGGTGTVGVAELANKKNDGYTIGVASLSPLSLLPWVLEVPYTPDNFEYICAFGQYGFGIVVGGDSPYNTLDELLEAAKTQEIKCGATGYPQPFAMDDLNEATGSQLSFVSYPSTTDMITDVLGGFIPCAVCDEASFTTYVEDGSMKLLASATDVPWACAPDVPTLMDLGYDINIMSYMGLCVPAGTDEAIVAKLREAFELACKDEGFIETIKNGNLVPTYMTGEEYEKLVYEKYEEYKVLLADVNAAQ
ncbi:MAG: tripartite tricarboxylate transporter substrate binding protein [Ruminococcaceae bacterium]|nr:tripartite tricarboxylate transporter substrate binding protein [Oscillospiraceae bacterium]